jgi:hypothetical protein
MAETRTNAAGETVEYNEDTDRWEPVDSEKDDEGVEGDSLAPEGETVVKEGNAPERRAPEDDR